MANLQDILRSVHASFPGNSNGRRRAAWFVFTILAIAMPFASSRTSDILRCLQHLFGICVTQRRFYRFLGSPKLPWTELWKTAWRLIPSPRTGKRLILALDDFINPKSGALVYGCHHFFDHAAKQNQCKYPWSQNIVSLGLLKRVQKRWACLPLAARFYHLKKDLGARPIQIGKNFVKFQTKLQQAVEMIAQVAAAFPRENLLIVCDSWFGNNGLWKPLRENLGDRCNLLTRLRSNIVVFAVPQEQSGKRGRPRKYGDRLGNAKTLALTYRDKAQTYSVYLYGKTRMILAFDKVVILKTLRCQVRIVWVFNKSRWVALCTTDLSLSVQEIIEFYGARWKIEASFKELKREIGSAHTQTRNPFSVDNHLQLCMLTTLLIWIYTDNLDFVPRRRHAVRGREHFAFSDARRAFVQAATQEDFSWLSPNIYKTHGIPLVARFLRLVA
jgi:hypothetical protein